MAYKSIVISSGHGQYIRGAADVLDEVDEARLVTEELAVQLRLRGVNVVTFHDNTSHDQDTNLKTIVNFHNSKDRELDISVHFNAHEHTDKPMGSEVFYGSPVTLADALSAAMAEAGDWPDRGGKDGGNLYFCNNTNKPAVLLEVCFVDSTYDAMHYKANFETICDQLADVLTDNADEGEEVAERPPLGRPEGEVLKGTCSWFGGPDDEGVSPSEGLAFIYDVDDAPHLFLPYQPEGTTGLARRLNPHIHYFAMRFDYNDIPKSELLDYVALVRNPHTGMALTAFPADWGPHEEKTGRLIDISPGLMLDLGLATDDQVEVIWPYETGV